MKKVLTQVCDPNEVAIKSFFLGPMAENGDWLWSEVEKIFLKWFEWRKKISYEDQAISKIDLTSPQFVMQQIKTEKVIQSLLSQFEKEIPKFSPRYMGHMFSEISMPALLGHIIALLHNPNNISTDASTVGLKVEKAAIAELAKMMGYSQYAKGHFTSGGTVANYEFLVRARERLFLWAQSQMCSGENNLMRASSCGWRQYNQRQSKFRKIEIEKVREKLNVQKPILFVSGSKHYSWPKGIHLIGLPDNSIQYIELDVAGRASSNDLKLKLERALLNGTPVLGVVNIAGTTELGTVDNIHETKFILEKFRRNEGVHVWFHIDAAYGGFFRSLVGSSEMGSLDKRLLKALSAISFSDSITLDPHKLGYVPYASGSFICRQSQNYFVKSFSGPYLDTDYSNLGNFTLEGSRSATGAVATYASLKSFEYKHGYARVLSRTLQVKESFKNKLDEMGQNIYFPEALDTNVLGFVVIKQENNLDLINKMNLEIYNYLHQQGTYWISKTKLDGKSYKKLISQFRKKLKLKNSKQKDLTVLRLTLMNPFVVSKESNIDHISDFCLKLKTAIEAVSTKKGSV